jgi:hypothetical protein
MSQPDPDYPPPPPNYTGGYGDHAPRNTRNTFSILAIVFGVVAVIFFPIVFGVAAIVLAVVARSKGERLSRIALPVAIVGTVVGFILGYLVYTSQTGA